jgi:hypothetical protein
VKTYLVFEPAGGGRNLDTADRILFLREKFSWPALLFAPAWLLWHRLWLGLAGWIAVLIILAITVVILKLDSTLIMLGAYVPSLVIALEATELRRRKLLYRGYREAGVVVAADLEDAERRFFADWVTRARPAQPAPAARSPSGPLPPEQQPVIGLFPEPGATR